MHYKVLTKIAIAKAPHKPLIDFGLYIHILKKSCLEFSLLKALNVAPNEIQTVPI